MGGLPFTEQAGDVLGRWFGCAVYLRAEPDEMLVARRALATGEPAVSLLFLLETLSFSPEELWEGGKHQCHAHGLPETWH